MKRGCRVPVSLLLVVCLVGGSYAVDNGRVLKSVVFPGMGQLADDQVIKGLGFMTAEAVCLSLMFGQFSRMHSYARHTEILQVRDGMAETYQDKKFFQEMWAEAYDNADKARMGTMIFGGVAALCWGLNIADAILYGPADSGEQGSLHRRLLENTTVAADRSGARVGYTFQF